MEHKSLLRFLILFLSACNSTICDNYLQSNDRYSNCEDIPDSCSANWLLFNPTGMQTYYYRSACFLDLAIKNNDINLCDNVIEKKSFFLNGSHFSSQECKNTLNQTNSDINTKTADPNKIFKIQDFKAHLDPNNNLHVDIKLSDGIPGTYAINLTVKYDYKKDKYRDNNVVDTRFSLNPSSPDITYDYEKYTKNNRRMRFNPISSWLVKLNSDNIKLSVDSSQIKNIKIDNQKFDLNIELQFLESAIGEIPATSATGKEYRSKISKEISIK